MVIPKINAVFQSRFVIGLFEVAAHTNVVINALFMDYIESI